MSSLLFTVIVVVYVISVYKGYSDADNYYKNITKDNTKIISTMAANGSDLDGKIDFDKLLQINSECVGWIKFDNLDINYPIVKGIDNEFYLSHLFSKEKSKSGCIYMNSINNKNFLDKDTYLFGHNMRDKSMFARLRNLLNREVYDKNHYFWIYTPHEMFRCSIFSCYQTDSSKDVYPTSFFTDADFMNYLTQIKSKSNYDTNVEIDSKAHLVTLMTCAASGENNRVVIHAMLESIHKSS